MPFASRGASRNYAVGQFARVRTAGERLLFGLGEWATQCRASHCIERPARDRGQALGVRFFTALGAGENRIPQTNIAAIIPIPCTVHEDPSQHLALARGVVRPLPTP